MPDLWGPETAKAVENFPVSGRAVDPAVIRWMGRIKQAAAEVNGQLEVIDQDLARRIATAAGEIAGGGHRDQFPVDVFQTGSGTSTNMNVNEVIATLAGPGVHPNDHVNAGQSSNDVFPSAVQLAVLELIDSDLLGAVRTLAEALEAKAREFASVVKPGRTHLMDAVPVTLGQEMGGYGAQVRACIDRIEGTRSRLARVPLGGTAVGTGLNTHREFATRVRAELVSSTGLDVSAPTDHFEAQASRDSMVEASGVLRVLAVALTKIAGDLALMASGPATGLGEIMLPELQKGSSIMPGKVNPVMCEVVAQVAAEVIGNDVTVGLAGSQGNFELNVRVPVMAHNLIESVRLLATSTRLFAERCVRGIEANVDALADAAERSPAVATALVPLLGYDRVAELVKESHSTGRPLRELAVEAGVPLEEAAVLLDAAAMTRPHDG